MALWTNSARTEVHDDDNGENLNHPRWPKGLVQITQAEADIIISALIAPIPLSQQAKNALDKSDVTMLRCVEAGITVPPEWNNYRKSLRAIANGTDTISTTLPTQPNYPAGT